MSFSSAQGRIIFNLLEGVHPAPRIDRDMGISFKKLEQRGNLDATFAIDHDGGMEGLLNGVVQSAKSLHESLANAVFDVWFTGARGFNLPVRGGFMHGREIISFAPERYMRKGQQYQSVLRVETQADADDATTLGYIMFGFKSVEIINVD